MEEWMVKRINQGRKEPEAGVQCRYSLYSVTFGRGEKDQFSPLDVWPHESSLLRCNPIKHASDSPLLSVYSGCRVTLHFAHQCIFQSGPRPYKSTRVLNRRVPSHAFALWIYTRLLLLHPWCFKLDAWCLWSNTAGRGRSLFPLLLLFSYLLLAFPFYSLSPHSTLASILYTLYFVLCTRYSLLTAHCSLFTVHHSLFTNWPACGPHSSPLL